MKLIWGIAISALLLVSIIGFDDSWALKSQGSTLTRTMVGNICGLDFCDTTQEIDEKISDYLRVLEKSSIEIFDLEDFNKSIPYITKTSIVSKDFLLIHYSDGNWELIKHLGFVEGLKKPQSESGQQQREFGGTIDLGSLIEDSDTVGMFLISQSTMIRPISDNIKNLRIYGNIGDELFPNVLVEVKYPDRPSQTFILSVDDTGNFEAEINIDKNTPLGVYEIAATYSSAVIGNVSFTLNEQEIFAFGLPDDKKKINSINLSTNNITIPSSFSSVQIIQISGTIADYNRGNMIEIILVSENGDESTIRIFATSRGEYLTFISITPEFPEGITDILLKYRGEEVAKTTLTAINPVFMLR